MQKKLIVIALAAISAAPAFAQSNVTVYGRVDYGWMTRSGNSGGVLNTNSRTEFAPGLAAGSRVGFRGTEDLGNGLKAIFEVESGIQNDEGRTANGGGLFSVNRHSWVGLTGGFGTVIGGRLDGVRYGIFNKYDAFGGGNVGNFTQMTGQVDRANNAVAYVSPSMSGFQATLAYGTAIGGSEGAVANSPGSGGNTGNQGDGRLTTLMGAYNNGPISLAIDWEQVKVVADGSALGGKTKVNTIAGSYDFGMVKVSALWDSHKADNAAGVRVTDYRDYFISLKAPVMGKANVKFTWGKVDNKVGLTDNDATKLGLGFDYALSKRTALYANYGKISNKGTAAWAISPLGNSQMAGYGVKGFDLGMAHNF